MTFMVFSLFWDTVSIKGRGHSLIMEPELLKIEELKIITVYYENVLVYFSRKPMLPPF